MDLTTRRRALMAKIIALVKMVVTSATGLVSFVTDIVRPVEVTCKFSPVQEGTGDPSPDNVIPISGWTGCEISHASINLADVAWENGAIGGDSTGSQHLPYAQMKVSLSTRIRVKNLISVDPHGIYIISVDFDTYEIVIQRYDASGRLLASSGYTTIGVWLSEQTIFTSFSENIAIAIRRKDGADITVSELSAANPQIFDTTTMQSIPITFTAPSSGDPLTVYGGTVALNEDGSADLVSTLGRLKMSEGTITLPGSAFQFIVNGIKNSNKESESPVYCTCYKSRYGITPSQYPSQLNNFECGLRGGYSVIYFKDNRFPLTNEGIAQLRETLANQYIYYTLSTPQTYHFDDIGQLQSFLGTNNIWHNMNGDITVEYWNKQ